MGIIEDNKTNEPRSHNIEFENGRYAVSLPWK